MAHRSHLNMAEFFGVDASEVFDEKEKAEGYLGGASLAQKVQDLIHAEHGERSRAFKEGLAEGLRDNL